MKTTKLLCAALLSLFGVSRALDVSGTVLNIDGSPKEGVVVRLSSGTDSAVTNASGVWSLGAGPSAVSRRAAASPVSGHLQVRGGRLEVQFGGLDVSGRRGVFASVNPTVSRVVASRAAGGVDSIVYTWKGRRFLRDTVSESRSGMVRVFDTTWNANIVYGYLFDGRDQQTYRTVQIGSQLWMAQNLNFKGTGVDSGWAYNNQPDSARKHGRLYTWASVMGLTDSCNTKICSTRVSKPQRGICPSGWHVPSDAEWRKLTDTTLNGRQSGILLKSSSGWLYSGNGTDSVGFHALPSGIVGGGTFYFAGNGGNWWSATEFNASYAWTRGMDYGDPYVNGTYGKSNGFSLRCSKD